MTTITTIADIVADHYGLTRSHMFGKRRARHIAWPRQVAMYACRKLTNANLPEIGRYFGRDHTTIMHAVRSVRKRMLADPAYMMEVNGLLNKCDPFRGIDAFLPEPLNVSSVTLTSMPPVAINASFEREPAQCKY